ncbi:MAG: uncharacterized protein QOD42_2433 [Sphingomonadales bacterium]|jgi:hypothetical protein|nr:uncharacterized protein [Sphingomonadales bacterium]
MAISLYDLTVPVYVRSLANLSAILGKGAAFAAEKGLDPVDLLATRLVDDMAPLTAQVQRATDTAKGTMVRVGGAANVVFEDNEETFQALQERIANAVAFIRAVPRAALDGKEGAAVSLDLPDGRSIPFTGQSYVLGFAIPNFFFHMTTAYALLRHRGVPVGKLDYLGGI